MKCFYWSLVEKFPEYIAKKFPWDLQGCFIYFILFCGAQYIVDRTTRVWGYWTL